MGLKKLWSFLFKTPEKTSVNEISNNTQIVKEKDNIGTRIETVDAARSYYMSTIIADMGGEICWKFKKKEDAINALLELPCVNVAEDTGRLVCTEPLNFGVYPFKPWDDYIGEFEWTALLSGASLNEELWFEAKKAFEKYKGASHRENKPKPTHGKNVSPAETLDSVTFSHKRKEKATFGGKMCTYHHYKAPNKATAIKWLQTQTVTKDLLYLVVETPDGLFSKDKMGMF